MTGALKRGEVLYEIADEKSLFVEALLHQRHATSVWPGQRAVIKVSGAPALTGRVRAVCCPGPGPADTSVAIHQPARDLTQMRVLIDFDEVPEVSLLGRQARVAIGEYRLAAWLFGIAR